MNRPRFELVTVFVWASVAVAAGMFCYRCATAPHTTIPTVEISSAEPAPASMPTGLPSPPGRPQRN